MSTKNKFEGGKFYQDYLPDVTKNRAAVAGERAVKSKGTEFLPPLASMQIGFNGDPTNGYEQIIYSGLSPEGQIQYKKYLSLAYFYGASGRTVDGLTGLIFMKPASIELPSQIEAMKKNADGKGSSLRKLSEELCKEAFITPRLGLLVDYPNQDAPMSKALAETLNLKPKILTYKFESILEVFFEEINNQQSITMALLAETVKSRSGFEVKESKIYRMLELDEQGYYQQVIFDEKGDEIEVIQPKMNGQRISEIPFYLIEVGTEGKSIINDLVDANFNHYRFFADYASKEHSSAFPIFWETGVMQSSCSNNYIGPAVKWENPSSEANFGILQSASDGGSMRQYLLDMEARMAALGAEMLKPRIAGAESAESKSLDQVAQNSTVGSVAINVSEAITKALEFSARWSGYSGDEIAYSLNQDYNPSRMSAQDLTALVASVQGGVISYETFYENLKKGEIARPKVTAEQEREQILNESIGMGEA